MAIRHPVCAASDLPPGERKLVGVENRTVGVFNVNGSYCALLNRCPHTGGALCEGVVSGTNLPVGLEGGYRYEHGRRGEILRCALHGWEFDIATGACLTDPQMRAKTFPVEVEDGTVFVIA